MRAPNPDCPVCSVAQTRVLVDMSRATLNDLVEDFLKLQLGYGEEVVVNHENDLLYDVEETDNLHKKLCDLGRFIYRQCVKFTNWHHRYQRGQLSDDYR